MQLFMHEHVVRPRSTSETTPNARYRNADGGEPHWDLSTSGKSVDTSAVRHVRNASLEIRSGDLSTTKLNEYRICWRSFRTSVAESDADVWLCNFHQVRGRLPYGLAMRYIIWRLSERYVSVSNVSRQ